MFSACRRLMNSIIARRALRRFTRPPRARDARRHDRAALRAFRRACQTESPYRKFLAAAGVRPETVRTSADFRQRVPVVTKDEVFGLAGWNGYLAPRRRRRLSSLYVSSGFTDRFSIGAATRRDEKRMAFFIEEILFRIYGIESRDLLVINCLSLGTDIPLRVCPQARTGLRDDSVVEVLRRAGEAFAAVVLIGEPHMLKRVVERGTAMGLAWERMTVFVFTGSEYLSESWRAYIRRLLRQDSGFPARGAVISTLGVTELGLALLFETYDLIALRSAVRAAGAADRLLDTESGAACPHLMHYFPDVYRLETDPESVDWGELCVTALDTRRAIPLVRYKTGDEVRLLSPAELERLFSAAGLPASLYRFKGLPAAAVRGRAPRLSLTGGTVISANEIKEALFSDHETARGISGNFRLAPLDSGTAARLLIQLAEGRDTGGRTTERMRKSLAEILPEALRIEFCGYRDFPYGFGHDFERKNRYL